MAFNVDIEMGISPDDPKKFRYHCATMTNVWHIDRSMDEFEGFVAALTKDKTITMEVPLPKKPSSSDEAKVEAYVARLGCTPTTLRWPGFHDFIGIPEELRAGGLKYVKHRPFGKPKKEGLLAVPPRFVQKKPASRFVQLCQEGRSSYVIVYSKKGETYPMSFFKISSGTRFSRVDAIPHAFAFQLGKRQWVFIAAGASDFKKWTTKCIEILGSHGVQVDGFEVDEAKGKFKGMGKSLKGGLDKLTMHDKSEAEKTTMKRRKKYEKAKKANRAIRKSIVDTRKELESLSRLIEEWQQKKGGLKSGETELRRQKEEELRKEMITVEETHLVAMETKRRTIEKLHQKIEELELKAGTYRVGTLFSDGFAADTDVQTEETDAAAAAGTATEESKYGDEEEDATKGMDVDEDGNVIDIQPEEIQGKTDGFLMTFKNMHKHKHEHILVHRHVHYHDDTVEKDVVYTQTQTFAHTIVHTQTQFQVKKSVLG
jgi:hypothetical protein